MLCRRGACTKHTKYGAYRARAAGFSQNRDQPVKIEAASLEVRDKDKTAIFSGNVVVTQGDVIIEVQDLLSCSPIRRAATPPTRGP